ncbi:MAG: tRNA (cytosine(32)/uridine(32)-2'-O)-methyltransferase TrmJ [Gammaproteobacteria bacterium]|jgi:tRNA (cytidine32/uridine32-2'-O)-methyltransferase|nr:tRNA (cytosine(32)/uridine(32)-2'-O)-methyltransferase TrmJ [Gammaproteobacteria bacterium]
MSDVANLFPGVKVILIETSHPGNIGAAARAMKNMGLTELVLVNPHDYPNQKSIFRAVSAGDVVRDAQVVGSVDEAIADCQLVIGTSARDRRVPWPMLSPRECGVRVAAAAEASQKVGLMFGRESRGLKNEELQKCHYHVNIPTGEAYSSLNLAMAVQVITYEILQGKQGNPEVQVEWDRPFADAAAMEHFFVHLEETLIQVDFHDEDNPRRLMTRLRRLFNRIQPDQMEVQILRGILNAINRLHKRISS